MIVVVAGVNRATISPDYYFVFSRSLAMPQIERGQLDIPNGRWSEGSWVRKSPEHILSDCICDIASNMSVIIS